MLVRELLEVGVGAIVVVLIVWEKTVDLGWTILVWISVVVQVILKAILIVALGAIFVGPKLLVGVKVG